MLKYKDLSEDQKKFITNGCGGKGGWVKPPNFIFLASCNHHDFKFWLGCSESDFKKSNDDFYMWMKKDIENAKWYLKPYYHIWAYSYYKSVSKFGRRFFYFAENRKTMYELIREIKTKKEKNELDKQFSNRWNR